MRKNRNENESDVAHNVRVASDWPPTRWRQWLLTALRHGTTAPLRVSRMLDPLDALEDLFANASEHSRDNVKEGVLKAVREWDEVYYDVKVLDRLCWAAERLRVSDIVAPAAEILRMQAERGRLRASTGTYFEVADDIVSILVGFAPDRAVEDLCMDLLFNDDVTHRLASLLALGVCMTNRRRFVSSLDQFIVRRAQEPDYFNDEQVAVEFTRAVSPQTVAAELRSLSVEAQFYLLLLIRPGAHVPREIAETRRTVLERIRVADMTFVESFLRDHQRREKMLIAARAETGRKQTVTEWILNDIRADIETEAAR